MGMDSDLYDHYRAVFVDLQDRREKLALELQKVDASLAVLSGLLANSQPQMPQPAVVAPPTTVSAPQAAPVPSVAAFQASPLTSLPPVPAHLRYANISVRLAVLSLMAEHAPEPLRTAEIVEALIAGGARQGGQNYSSNVSAVVSDMTKKKGELSVEDGKYTITDHGRDVWAGIKRSPTYKYRRLTESAQNGGS